MEVASKPECLMKRYDSEAIEPATERASTDLSEPKSLPMGGCGFVGMDNKVHRCSSHAPKGVPRGMPFLFHDEERSRTA
jgi:hypothetical protein